MIVEGQELELPIRLNFLRRGQILGPVVTLIIWIVMGALWLFSVPVGYLPWLVAEVTSLPTAAKLVPLGLVLLVFASTAIAVALHLLPNSASHHLIIDRQGLTYRHAFWRQKIGWNEISEIALLALNGRWMLAVEGIPAPTAASDWKRYRAAPLKFDLARILPFLASKEEAMTVVDWLNGLLKDADSDQLSGKTVVPGLLLRYIADSSAPMTSMPRRRKRPTVNR